MQIDYLLTYWYLVLSKARVFFGKFEQDVKANK